MVVKSEKFKENNPLVESNTAIIVTSYDEHLIFLKKVLSHYKATKKYVICSYDKYGSGYNKKIPDDIFRIPHSWSFKHQTHGADKRNGWLWDIIYAAGIVSLFDNFEYVFTVNGDCIWQNPKGIEDVIQLLGDYDLMSSSSAENIIHSCSVIWKRTAFLAFVSYIRQKLNVSTPQSHSPEELLVSWWRSKQIRVKHAPLMAKYPEKHYHAGAVDHYSAYHQDSTWKRLLGYRNLGGEHKWRCLEHLEPIPKRFMDLRNNGAFFANQHERDTLLHFYLTQDRRWLYKYWAEGEDSYWNRRYYPLEYYGDKPLHNDELRKTLGPPSERLGFFDRWKLFDYIVKDEEYRTKWKTVIDDYYKR